MKTNRICRECMGSESRVLRPTTIYCVLPAVMITNQKKSDEFPVPQGLTGATAAVARARAEEAARCPDRTPGGRNGLPPRPFPSLRRSVTALQPAIQLAGATERRDSPDPS